MTEFTELWPGGPRYAQADHFPLGTDSVLLADFVPLAGAKRGVDLGCGGGVLTLLLLARSDKLSMTGLEILPAAAKRAEENLRENGLEVLEPICDLSAKLVVNQVSMKMEQERIAWLVENLRRVVRRECKE